MTGPFVHDIDPVLFSVWGVHAWWYGLSYSLGFVSAHLALRRNRERLGLSMSSVYEMTLLLAGGVLAGGRALVVFNEWAFYREHLSLIPAVWIGGLATHGLIAGGAAGVLLFCLVRRQPFRPVFDAFAIPAALILGFGRIGNFIDGQIVGSVTTVPWAVQFPEADGFRHPVVLYDGLKNFALLPILLCVRRRGVPPGRLAALFVVLYAGLRIPIDMLREYPLTLGGLPSGQMVNVIMAVCGAALLLKNWLRPPAANDPAFVPVDAVGPRAWQRLAFVALLLLALVIPSDATRDVPVTYGHRHAGLEHSRVYPVLGPGNAKAAR
ncbi:MAG: prolipoprotein diacylglyceryl transferase [Acidobacteria bacterium]|nr:MAG: prolipoprotein diacylglyceryl transferase [Acidobacteriota bacterium]